MTQSDPFCTSIITSNKITRANSEDIIIKNGDFSYRSTVRTGTKNRYGHQKTARVTIYFTQIYRAYHARTETFPTENDQRNSDFLLFKT